MKFHLVLKLRHNIKIFADKLNWVLEVDSPNNRFYYSTLDELCDDLLEIRITKKLSKNQQKDIAQLSITIGDIRESVRDDLERLEKLMTNADTLRKKGVFNG